LIDGYKHHVFVSYARSGDIPGWLHTHFVPVLTNRLEAILDEDPDIFVDQKIEVGTDWPDVLDEALNQSCCMIAVWSPKYFRSKWCLAEWETMLAREEKLGLKSNGSPGLVYPVVYSGGKSFPEIARRTQQRVDLSGYAYPYPQFRNTDKFLAFHDKVSEIADDLQQWLDNVPPWSPDWERIKKPEMSEPDPPRFRRL